tara:strand:- start:3786 stop:3947 length:162 start_codon:yes stop_codon:yes gene_type:complete
MSKALESRIVKLETENHIQYKEIFFRLKRIELIGLGGITAVIGLLVNVLVMIY